MRMSPKERWLAVLKRERVDRVPSDIWATPEVVEKLCGYFGVDDYWEVIDKLEIDRPFHVGGRYIGPKFPEGTDIWGVRYKVVDYGTGKYSEVDYHPLADVKALRELKEYPWPSADWFDFSDVKEQIEKHQHRPIIAGGVEPFLRYCYMRGMEQAMIDLIEAPDLVEYVFDRIFEFEIKQLERVLNQVGDMVDVVSTAEDLGSQTGPLFSVKCFREIWVPRFKKYIELAKQVGAYIFYHTDGSARVFIPDLIEMGVNILNPIQANCEGMEREGLKRDFGDKLIFHGSVDNQKILPFGTPEDVRSEVIDCFEKLGVGGGYICAPCHNIQPNTPIENILVMYQTIKEIGSEPKYIVPG